MSLFQKHVHDFHYISKQPAPDRVVTTSNDTLGTLRRRLINEEAKELCDAWSDFDTATEDTLRLLALSRLIDGMVDLMYVTVGAAVSLGIDLDPFWDLIHDNNMSKVDGRLGPRVYRDDGKILKPQGWREPDVLGLLKRILENQNGK